MIPQAIKLTVARFSTTLLTLVIFLYGHTCPVMPVKNATLSRTANAVLILSCPGSKGKRSISLTQNYANFTISAA